MQSTTCRTCNAEILWCITDTGKRMPVDAKPIKGMILEQKDHGKGLELYGTMGAVYISHFATCPAASKYHKSKESKAHKPSWHDKER